MGNGTAQHHGAAAVPPEALELVLAGRADLAGALAPVLAVFARAAGLGARQARVLAREVAALVEAVSRRAPGPVRVRLNRRPRRLRVWVRGGRPGAALKLMRRRRAVPGLSIERRAPGALVLNVSAPPRVKTS